MGAFSSQKHFESRRILATESDACFSDMFKTKLAQIRAEDEPMSETETILLTEAGVKQFEGEHPPSIGLKAGAFADVGTIILTNKRFVYINKGGAGRAAAWALGGALTARAMEKSISKAELDDLTRFEGSYSIPLQQIRLIQTGRHMGQAYLRVDCQAPGLKPAYSYVFGSGFTKNEDWVPAINNAIGASRNPQGYAQPSYAPTYAPQQQNYPPPPPPPPQQPPTCPTCGNPLTFIPQYQRWYCYREQKYV
jgi:hypothetical protein